MAWLTTRRRVRTYLFTWGRTPDGLYCEDQYYINYLVWELLLFGRVVLWWKLDYEIIPMHVMIAYGIFNDTFGWRSKFAPFTKDGIQPK